LEYEIILSHPLKYPRSKQDLKDNNGDDGRGGVPRKYYVRTRRALRRQMEPHYWG
jgi:hypothetical protein